MNKLVKLISKADYDLNKVNISSLGKKDLETFHFLKSNYKKIVESSEREIVNCSTHIVNAILNYKNMAALDVEEFGVVSLNRRNEIIDISVLFKGGRAFCVADYKVIYKHVLDVKACSFVIFHNHPSGRVQPSQSDIKTTKKGKDFAKLLDMEMLDSIVISNGGNYFSFLDEGIL